MKEWFKLTEKDQKTIFEQVSSEKRFTTTAIEKDFWVMIALTAIFNTEFAKHLVFKGGTSLSKAWNIIERFSEDIDLAIDRSFFGYNGDLNRREVTKLRKKACAFVIGEFREKLIKSLQEMGVKGFEIGIVEFERSDTDPVAIELKYKSLTEPDEYLTPKILIEISSRSLRDPFENKELRSIVGEKYHDKPFADRVTSIPTVLPTRTFLEKIFLLHEEFQKLEDRSIKSKRMTRHLYDLSKLMETPFCDQALNDHQLYSTITKHREMLTKIQWVDYSKHQPATINIIPPDFVIEEWRKDYVAMSESMFYGETESFDDLIKKLHQLNKRINSITLR